MTPMAPLHSFGQDNQNAVQHGPNGHVMPLVLALVSCDVNVVTKGIIAFLRSR